MVDVNSIDYTPPTISKSVEVIKARLKWELKRDAVIEITCKKKGWIAYHDLSPVARTVRFIDAYNKVHAEQVTRIILNTDQHRVWVSNKSPGRYDNSMPWVAHIKKKPGYFEIPKSWYHWQAARRAADLFGYKYSDYLRFYFACAQLRSWPIVPRPAQLVNQKIVGEADNFVDARIKTVHDRHYERLVRWETESYEFSASSYTGTDVQCRYWGFIAFEFYRISGAVSQEAIRLWEVNQRTGQVPHGLTFTDAARYFCAIVR